MGDVLKNIFTKRRAWIAVLYALFMVLFWFVGPAQKMGKATAFFGVVGLTLVFAIAVGFAVYILDQAKKDKEKVISN